MGFFKSQLRSVIEWSNPDSDDLFYQWSDNGDEIKNASKLIVGPGQGAIFVYEGKVRTVISSPTMVDLKTDNIPFWTSVSRFMQLFEVEHKVAIFFFKTTKILNQKWGTTTAIRYEDPKYRFPVGLRAFGNYSFNIIEPKKFFETIVGHNSGYLVSSFRDVMIGRIIQPLADHLAESSFSYAEIDANRDELSSELISKLSVDFTTLGFKIADFRIEGTSFDDETVKRINRISDVSAEAQAAKAAGLNYSQLQQIEAMRDAAVNEGGGAGIGMGMGAGIGMGNMMAGAMESAQQDVTSKQGDPVEVLGKLKKMLDGDLITEDEYNLKKTDILNRM